MRTKQQLVKEIRLLRRIIAALESYSEMTHALDSQVHLDLYREWLQEAIAERETL